MKNIKPVVDFRYCLYIYVLKKCLTIKIMYKTKVLFYGRIPIRYLIVFIRLESLRLKLIKKTNRSGE